MLITSGCSTVAVEMLTLPPAEISVVATPPEKPAPVKLAKIEIRQQIRFEIWKAKILPDSFEVLDEVASALTDHPEIALLEIQGHTAKTKNPKRTLRLSNERARAVKKYLIDQGVDPERLLAKGYGEDVPIADNETAEGRQQNRRVEFVVLEHAGGDEVAVVTPGGDR